MSEGNQHAAILIAVSYQALNRALKANPNNILSDCTVVILFAGFYVEATLNHIFESIGSNIRQFPISEEKRHGRTNIGLQDKLAWFYNEFIENPKATNWKEIREKNTSDKLAGIFPGVSELIAFRNDLSHGRVNEIAKSLENTKNLRQQAKNIVKELYSITTEKGYNVPRDTKYIDAIYSLGDSHDT